MTTRSLLTMLVGAALAGCADGSQRVDDLSYPPERPIDAVASESGGDEADVDARVIAEDVRCEPMDSDGPCALICDPEALLEQHVPPGTCIHFVCTAPDGARRHLGACR